MMVDISFATNLFLALFILQIGNDHLLLLLDLASEVLLNPHIFLVAYLNPRMILRLDVVLL